MSPRRFTLAEARALLPQVKQQMALAQAARREIVERQPEMWPVLKAAAGNGGSKQAGELLGAFRQLETSVKGIMALGVLVKDVDSGLVDFPGVRAGREIYLCWHAGEDDIAFWHDIDKGFAGRQEIDDLVA